MRPLCHDIKWYVYAHVYTLLRVSVAFFSLISLKYLYISFFRSLPAPCLLLCSPPPLSRRKAIRVPLSSLPAFPPLALPLLLLCAPCLPCVVWCVPFRLPVPVACSVLSSVCSSHRARPEALRRPPVCRAVCPLVAAVTRPPSGAKRCDSVGRCTAYISPALSPLAYVLPCVPLVVPWLPSVRPCVCPAAVCRLVVVIGGTPLFRGRRRCGAASVM